MVPDQIIYYFQLSKMNSLKSFIFLGSFVYIKRHNFILFFFNELKQEWLETREEVYWTMRRNDWNLGLFACMEVLIQRFDGKRWRLRFENKELTLKTWAGGTEREKTEGGQVGLEENDDDDDEEEHRGCQRSGWFRDLFKKWVMKRLSRWRIKDNSTKGNLKGWKFNIVRVVILPFGF